MKLFCISILACAVFLVASPYVHAEDVRFGVVDMVKVLEGSEAGKKVEKELSSRIEAAESDIVKRQEELLSLKEEIEKQAMMLSADVLAKKEREYQDKLLEYQRKLQDYNYELQNRKYDLIQVIMTESDAILQEIAVDGEYTLILERTNSGVLYFQEDIDLTNDVIEALDK
jgi:outer membrane protein